MAFEVKIPSVGESITEVTIASWTKSDGDYVEEEEIICEIDSDKATFEINAEESGTLKIKAQEGDTIQVGDTIATIDTSAAAPEKKEKQKQTKEEAEPQKTQTASGAAEEKKAKEGGKTYVDKHPSPAAEKILKEHDIDPSTVNGSGKDGRVTKEDALKAAEAQKSKPATETSKSAPQPAAEAGSRNTREEKMTTLRKTIARRLVDTKNKTAMLTTFNEVDMSEVKKVRSKYKDKFKEKYEVNLGFMSFFVKACCQALRDFPQVNAQIDGEQIIFHDYCDIGIAVSTPRGLVVPVIRNAESMSLAEVEKEIIRLAQRGRDGKISIEEMEGGTFTITNGGVFGSMLSTPIINDPQSAILGMHNIVDRPVAVNGEVQIRPVMYLALSYDHRLVDGKESVSFLYRVKEMIEDPSRLLLEI